MVFSGDFLSAPGLFRQLMGPWWNLAVLETSDGYIKVKLMLFLKEFAGISGARSPCPDFLMEIHPEVWKMIG